MRTLKDVLPGQTARVLRLCDEGAIKRRLLDMGINRDTEILVLNVPHLGDPMEVNVRGYEMSLRKADIDVIEIREN
jgi:ferrous iron transport protein A